MYQLAYMSDETHMMSDDDLKEIYTKSSKNNKPRGITGMLFYSDGQFLQILEGEESEVKKLYDYIAEDTRHTDCVLVSESHADERLFPDWSMGFKKVNSNEIDLLDKSKSKEDLVAQYNSNPHELYEIMKTFVEQ